MKLIDKEIFGLVMISIIFRTTGVQVVGIRGGNVTMECSVEMASPPVVKWQDDVFIYDSLIDIFTAENNNIIRNEGHSAKDHFELDNSTYSLKIINVNINFRGKYICESKVDGRTNKITYELSVFKQLKCERNGTFNRGNEYIFTCEVEFSGRPPSLILYKKDGTSLEKQYEVESDIDFILISYHKTIAYADDGDFLKCKTELDELSDECVIHIDVNHPTTSVTFIPSEGIVDVGNKVTCMANGKPKPSVVIYKDGEKEGTNVTGVESASLTMRREWANQNIKIRCEAGNTIGLPVFNNMTVIVGDDVTDFSSTTKGVQADDSLPTNGDDVNNTLTTKGTESDYSSTTKGFFKEDSFTPRGDDVNNTLTTKEPDYSSTTKGIQANDSLLTRDVESQDSSTIKVEFDYRVFLISTYFLKGIDTFTHCSGQ